MEQIGVHDNFFELGGTPCWPPGCFPVKPAFSIELPLRELFKTLTVAGLSEVIEKN